MKSHVKYFFSATRMKGEKNETWKTWKGVCGEKLNTETSF